MDQFSRGALEDATEGDSELRDKLSQLDIAPPTTVSDGVVDSPTGDKTSCDGGSARTSTDRKRCKSKRQTINKQRRNAASKMKCQDGHINRSNTSTTSAVKDSRNDLEGKYGTNHYYSE